MADPLKKTKLFLESSHDGHDSRDRQRIDINEMKLLSKKNIVIPDFDSS
jgi:hypothetical protein